MKAQWLMSVVMAWLMLFGAGGLRGQTGTAGGNGNTTAGGGGNVTAGGNVTTSARPLLPPLTEAVTLSIEGNSLMTGDPISGKWTGCGPKFSATMVSEADSKVKVRFAGTIERENGKYRVEFNFAETALRPFKTADGNTINGMTTNGMTAGVLLPLDEPVRVLSGSGENLTLKLTKVGAPTEPSQAKPSASLLIGNKRLPENVALKVQAELLKGSPFEITLTGAGAMSVSAMVPVAGDEPFKHLAAHIYATLAATTEGYRMDYKVVMSVMVPAGSNAAGPLYQDEPVGAASTTYLPPGAPVTVLDSNLGNLTFTLTEMNGNTTTMAGK